MSDKVKGLFTQHLLKEYNDTLSDDSVFRDRSGPPEEDGGEAFEQSLDRGTDPNDLDVDGLGFDQDAQAVDNFVDVYAKVARIEEFYSDMIDPNNEDNLVKQLAIGDRNDSILNGVLQKLDKPILNAVKASQEIKAVLDGIASKETSLRKKIKAAMAT